MSAWVKKACANRLGGAAFDAAPPNTIGSGADALPVLAVEALESHELDDPYANGIATRAFDLFQTRVRHPGKRFERGG